MKKLPAICIWVASIISAVYLLMIGWYNVLSLDDYGYIAKIEEDGLCNLVRAAYMGWQCRFATFFVNGIIMLIFGRASNLIGVTVLMLFMGWLSVERLLNGINYKYHWQLPESTILGVAVLCTNIGILSFLKLSTFYWLSALNYTIVIWATIFLVYFVFFSSTPLWVRWIGTILCSIYISGSAENYAPLVILSLGIVWIVLLTKQKTWHWWTNETTHFLFISLLLMGIGCLVMLFGPGNKMRLEMDGGDSFLMGHLSLFTFAKRIVKSYCYFLVQFLSRGLYYVALLPVFIWIGSEIKNGKSTSFTMKQIGYIVLFWILFVLINVIAFIFGVGYVESRALCFMSFVLLALTGYVGIHLGMSHQKGTMLISAVLLSSLALILTMLFFIKTDLPLVKEYNRYVTTRNQQIEEKVQYYKSNNIPVIEQMPYVCVPFREEPKVPLMVSELTEDPNDWRNDGLRQYYHADFDIICKISVE